MCSIYVVQYSKILTQTRKAENLKSVKGRWERKWHLDECRRIRHGAGSLPCVTSLPYHPTIAVLSFNHQGFGELLKY